MREIIRKPLGFSLISNCLVLLVSVLIYHPFFEEPDDLYIAMISEGAFGSREYHLVYVNVILGKVLTFLSGIISGIRWHSVLQYLFIFIALCLLTYIFSGYRNGKIYAMIMQIATAYELYVSLQYTKTAAYVAAAGYIGLFFVLRRRFLKNETGRDKRIIMGISYALLAYAMLLRKDAFLLGTLVFFAVGVYELLRVKSHYLQYVFYFAPVFIAFLLAILADNASYTKDPEWGKFMNYNNVRMDLLDYRYDVMDYPTHAELLDSCGVSENDSILYVTWQFGDDTVLDTDKMNEILDKASNRSADADFLKALLANLYEFFYGAGSLIPAFFSVIFLALCSIWRKREERAAGKVKRNPLPTLLVMEGIIMCVVLLYYQYSGRWSHRIVAALFLTVFVAVLFEIMEGRSDTSASSEKNTVPVALSLVLGFLLFECIGLWLGNTFAYREDLRSEQRFEALADYMEQNKDTLFVADTFTVQDSYKYSVLVPLSVGKLSNYVTVGSWYVNSPITRAITESFGYANPFRALAGDNVVLIDNCYPNEKAVYISEHGEGPRYCAEYLERMYGYDLYNIW